MGSLFLGVIFSVVIFVILVLYVCSFQYPIFFVQERIGQKGKVFKLFKFRTLSPNVNTEFDTRRFFLGDFLRFFSLDELPQLWNVIRGDMSLIGPRPLPVEYFSLFSKDEFERHVVRPGITGWAQVNGRHSISWQKKFELDRYYVNHISFRLDALILFKTIVLLLSFKKDQSLKEEKFKGK